ncbi:hypothetical protein BC332_34606 [Capsicum chinense]|nr:hypothetical protein BC332_34606 [Capsicum chinense]
MELTALSRVADRYGLSDRRTAAVASATMESLGSLMPGNALFFDGHQDKTKYIYKVGKTQHSSCTKEEDISLIQEPGSRYIGHATPISSSTFAIKQSICSHLREHQVNSINLVAIGCDGTVTNTGAHKGVIRLMEEHLSQPLQWLICLLHFNELPLRHLIENLDGKYSGPAEFIGPIGKLLSKSRDLPVVIFEPIDNKSFPIINPAILSTDQKYFYEITIAVIEGYCPSELAERDPGNITHVRWLRTDNISLRLYIADEYPTDTLRVLANFIVNVFSQMWFEIKHDHKSSSGAKHLFKTVRLVSDQPEEVKAMFQPVIQNNGYFGHPENVLLAILADEDQIIKEEALARILKLCENTRKAGAVRKF